MKRFALYSALLAALCLSLPASAEESYNQTIQVKPIFKGTETSIGQAIRFPQSERIEASMMEVIIPPGAETGWHSHPAAGFAYVVSGTLTVELEGGKSAQFTTEQGFAEVINTLHNGKNTGSETVRLWVVFTAEAGKPYAIKAPKAAKTAAP